MKLRNKKTGEIVELKLIQVNDKYLEDHEINLLNGKKLTLESLVNSFSDVKEPLINDNKIRKAVRAWAEVNSIKTALYSEIPNKSLCQLTDMGDEDYDIQFVGWIPTLKDGEEYTITELCGEEEAPEPIEPTFIDLDERIKGKEEK